jgi:DNA-binding CsgD family transcriptional regulator
MRGTRQQIAALHAQDLPTAEIARRLGLAQPTVTYHLRRLTEEVDGRELSVQPTPVARDETAQSAVRTRESVARLLTAGLGKSEIARELGISKGTVSYHARRLGAPIDSRGARRYDWEAIQCYYDAGHSVRECQLRFGFSRQSWSAAVKRGAVVARVHGLPLDELLVQGTARGRDNLKRRLLRAGLKENHCEECGLSEWRGRPIVLALHHVNGKRHDNRLENLQLMCPNCHSQTPNFAGKAPRTNLEAA